MSDVHEPTKRCSKCKQSPPVSSFGKDKNKTDGLTHWCKPCQHASKAESMKRKANTTDPAPTHPRCCRCKQTKERSAFGNDKAAPWGIARQCKQCRTEVRAPKREELNAKKREWTANNQERVSEYNRTYHAEHRDERLPYMRTRQSENKEEARVR
jgi:hypothetical protein